jgi:hypothetical protein
MQKSARSVNDLSHLPDRLNRPDLVTRGLNAHENGPLVY